MCWCFKRLLSWATVRCGQSQKTICPKRLTGSGCKGEFFVTSAGSKPKRHSSVSRRSIRTAFCLTDIWCAKRMELFMAAPCMLSCVLCISPFGCLRLLDLLCSQWQSACVVWWHFPCMAGQQGWCMLHTAFLQARFLYHESARVEADQQALSGALPSLRRLALLHSALLEAKQVKS